jgi:hypothetical protein
MTITNQFFYTRETQSTTEVPDSKEYRDSFNVNKVIRSITNEDGSVLVLLDDLHERSHDVPDIDLKTNKMKGTKRQRDIFQSEITLNEKDGERFFKLLNIEK